MSSLRFTTLRNYFVSASPLPLYLYFFSHSLAHSRFLSFIPEASFSFFLSLTRALNHAITIALNLSTSTSQNTLCGVFLNCYPALLESLEKIELQVVCREKIKNIANNKEKHFANRKSILFRLFVSHSIWSVLVWLGFFATFITREILQSDSFWMMEKSTRVLSETFLFHPPLHYVQSEFYYIWMFVIWHWQLCTEISSHLFEWHENCFLVPEGMKSNMHYNRFWTNSFPLKGEMQISRQNIKSSYAINIHRPILQLIAFPQINKCTRTRTYKMLDYYYPL